MPARLCQQWRIQGRGPRPNWDLGPKGRKMFLDTAPPLLSQGLDDWGFPLSQGPDDRAPSYFRLNDRAPLISGWMTGSPPYLRLNDRAPSYFRLNDRAPLISGWMTGSPPLIWRTGSTTGQGPLLSCSSFAKGMKKSMNLRSFCKTKPLSARFPLKNFNPFRTNFTFFINSFVYLFGRLRRGELTHEHRNNYNYNWSRFHSLDYEQSLFFL